MGGNALQVIHGFETRRVPAHEYHDQIVPALRRELSRLFPKSAIEVVRSYRAKPDFGDIDILVETTGLGPNWIRDVLDHFKPRASTWSGRRLPEKLEGLKPEGNAFSIEYQGFQVDLLPVRAEEFTWSSNYYAYNDLGNLIGRLAHKMGMKFGHDALWYYLYNPVNPTHVFEELCVTQHSWDRALALLGLDPARFHAGFNQLEDVFEYVGSSPYFNADIYLLDNRNHRARTRDRKRKTYMQFLEWASNRPDLPAFAWASDKAAYLPIIEAAFPEFARVRAQAMKRREQERLVAERFNGDKVRAATGLEGQVLGEYMDSLRALFPSRESLKAFVLSASDEQIDRFIRIGEIRS